MSVRQKLEPRKAEIISAFLSGLSCQKIVQELALGCSPDAVRVYLKEWGIDTSPRYLSESWGVSPERRQQILDLRALGKTQQEIADIFSISKERVKQILSSP
jgi:DNA-binding NarL/FixJ family response regulator